MSDDDELEPFLGAALAQFLPPSSTTEQDLDDDDVDEEELVDEPVLDAARTGDRLRTLEALRAQLAARIDSAATTGAELASLSRQLTQVTAEIERLAEPEEDDPVDELARRRAERDGTDGDPGASAPGRVSGRSKRRT